MKNSLSQVLYLYNVRRWGRAIADLPLHQREQAISALETRGKHDHDH